MAGGRYDGVTKKGWSRYKKGYYQNHFSLYNDGTFVTVAHNGFPYMPSLSISLLGSFQVLLNEGESVRFETNKVQALLAYLAVESGRSHERSVLAGFLWPDQSEQNARNNLRQSLFRLRRAIGDQSDSQPFLELTPHTICFNQGSDYWLDVQAFTRLLQGCRQHVGADPAGCPICREQFQEGVALYQGDFLAGFGLGDSPAFEEWLTMQREWLRRQQLQALGNLVAVYEGLKDYDQALSYARQQLELDSLAEAGHRDLMRLLALSGQRGAAMAQYRLCRQLLQRELSLEPTAETESLFNQIRNGQLVRGEKVTRPEPQPQPTPPASAVLVGRKQEYQHLLGLVKQSAGRIITLTGPAGIGKSALAKGLAANFQPNVCFVTLDGLSRADQLIEALAEQLGCDPSRPGLLPALRDREWFIVLDGFDRLLAESWLLLEWAQNSPQSHFLVTSRHRLNLSQEWLFVLDGLPLPAGESHDQLLDNDSVQLFLGCAGRINHDFVASEKEVKAIAQICHLVEGNPLGLELAANWVRVLSCQEIAEEIEKSPHALAYTLHDLPMRHRSLGALFEDSWQQLSAEEQRLLQCLALFRGGFTRPAAESVAQTNLPTLARLLDQSLIRRQNERYTLPELLRQFTAEKLACMPEEEAAQRRHAHYYANFLNQQVVGLRGKGQRQALEALEQELGNIQQSWRWIGQHQDQQALTLAATGLFHFYRITGRIQAGYDAFRLAASHSQQGQLLVYWGWFAHQLRQLTEAKELLQGGLSQLQEEQATHNHLQNYPTTTLALIHLAALHRTAGDYDEAARLSEQALTLSQQVGDWFAASLALNVGGAVAHELGQRQKARQMVEQSLVFKRLIGDRWGMTSGLNLLGHIAYTAGTYSEAERHFREELRLHQEVNNRHRMVACLNALGDVARVMLLLGQARQWYEECLAICVGLNDPAGISQSYLKLGQLARQNSHYQEAQHHYHAALKTTMSNRLATKTVEILIEFGYMVKEMKSGGISLPLTKPFTSDVPAGDLLADELLRQFTTMAVQDRVQTQQLQIMVNNMLNMVT